MVQGVCVCVCVYVSKCESLSANVCICLNLKTENTGMVRSELPRSVCVCVCESDCTPLNSFSFLCCLYFFFSLIVGNMFVHHLLTFYLIVLQFGKLGLMKSRFV